MTHLESWMLAEGYTPATLAKVLRVSRQAVYTWIHKDPDKRCRPKTEILDALTALSRGEITLSSFDLEVQHGDAPEGAVKP